MSSRIQPAQGSSVSSRIQPAQGSSVSSRIFGTRNFAAFHAGIHFGAREKAMAEARALRGTVSRDALCFIVRRARKANHLMISALREVTP